MWASNLVGLTQDSLTTTCEQAYTTWKISGSFRSTHEIEVWDAIDDDVSLTSLLKYLNYPRLNFMSTVEVPLTVEEDGILKDFKSSILLFIAPLESH